MSNILSILPCENPITLEKLADEFGNEFFHLHLNEFELLYIGISKAKNTLVVRHFSRNEDNSATLFGEWEL